MEKKVYMREVEVIISVQAQKILKQTNYSVEEFLDWALKNNKISFGGHNVMLFLEQKYKE